MINKDMKLAEVVQKYPETVEVFFKYGLYCIGCHLAQTETVEQGAQAHGIDVKELINDLNKAIENKKENKK